MKILYYSDNYADGVMGVKKSIAEEMHRRGHDVIFIHRRRINKILFAISGYRPDQIWLAHSGLVLPEEIKSKITIPVIGFGFSDPYLGFTISRLKSYDVYITNNYETYLKSNSILPTIYIPPSCDLNFHKREDKEKSIDISFMGCGLHPQFKNKTRRIDIINRLRNDGLNIEVFGENWPIHPNNHEHVSGKQFLDIINSTRIGIDIQEEDSPLAHRLFEYGICGVGMITLERPEISRMFTSDEILTYASYEELLNKLRQILSDDIALKKLGNNAYQKCLAEHTMKHRISKILDFLKKEAIK